MTSPPTASVVSADEVRKPSAEITPARRVELARRLYVKTGGKGWEPPDPYNPLIVALVADGYLRRTDGICVFERLPDACVTWTAAGRIAASHTPVSSDTPTGGDAA